VGSVLAPALVADDVLLASIIHDMRTRGRPHPANVVGGAMMLAVQILREPASTTQTRGRGLSRAVQ